MFVRIGDKESQIWSASVVGVVEEQVVNLRAAPRRAAQSSAEISP